jgi:hypothetical protein
LADLIEWPPDPLYIGEIDLYGEDAPFEIVDIIPQQAVPNVPV